MGAVGAVGAVDVVVESELARLRGELERLHAENIRLSRLLNLHGQDTAPGPEQLSAALAPPGPVVMSSPVADKLALYTDRFGRGPTCTRCVGTAPGRG